MEKFNIIVEQTGLKELIETACDKKQDTILTGDIPSPTDLPNGCKFHTRCVNCMDRCTKEEPKLKVFHDGHAAACFLNEL